ncbi:hypothetical protein [Curtobacterium aurantiacum]|uniref:Uncharacterized protein n=1 Tax=Curtobacterium aurantiacum TaxID=3236919 RepID=A0ABS5VAD5_9MICO|nr:hypothetical protein [Curtobacterium flaccumfaciens]MBT1545705.1 hypothetical protein [Curtobacterium flaccumfaciens pv. flaccumfaciens]MBT1586439.1 hypothetical protein [Curtobacterium flaccumfaciens pv. flaccumfaciens]
MDKPPPTWDKFKSAVRKIDRDSLLVHAAATSALLASDEIPEDLRRRGFTPWNVADVARTALAWGRFQAKRADSETLLRLANMNVQITDAPPAKIDPSERLARILARIFFEQFPSQRSDLAEFVRTILLFGSAAETPHNFNPEAMTQGWFENAADGLTLDEYVESIFLISVGAISNNGQFDPSWLDGPQFKPIGDLVSLEALGNRLETDSSQQWAVSKRRIEQVRRHCLTMKRNLPSIRSMISLSSRMLRPRRSPLQFTQ